MPAIRFSVQTRLGAERLLLTVVARAGMPSGSAARVGPTTPDARIMSRATTERSSSHQSTSGMGSGARSEGLLIKPTFSLLAAPSSVANRFPCVLRRSSIKRGFSLLFRWLSTCLLSLRFVSYRRLEVSRRIRGKGLTQLHLTNNL